MPDSRAPLDRPATTDGGEVRGSHRREAIVAVLLAVGVGLAIAVVFLWPSSRPNRQQLAAGSASLSQAQADQLAQQLSDPNPTVAAAALAAAIRPAFRTAPAALIPPGDTLRIDASSFARGADADHGTVQATATGPQAGTFLVLLVRENGAWHVLGTVQR